jgi:tyrosyl-DNA phosphodiesterase 2
MELIEGVERWDWGRAGAMMGLKVKEMEVLRPGAIGVPRPDEKPLEIPWSDHCGLRCNFTI